MTRTKSNFRCLQIEEVYKKAVFTAYQVRGSFAKKICPNGRCFCTNGRLENCDTLQTLKYFSKEGGENPKIPAISEGFF